MHNNFSLSLNPDLQLSSVPLRGQSPLVLFGYPYRNILSIYKQNHISIYHLNNPLLLTQIIVCYTFCFFQLSIYLRDIFIAERKDLLILKIATS